MKYTLIFIDFDDVLNSSKFLSKIKHQEISEPLLNHKNIPIYDESIADNYLYNSIDYNNLKPFMDCLEQIPNVKIVLSTSWRGRHNLQDWQKQFDNIKGWEWKIIGRTYLDGQLEEEGNIEVIGGYLANKSFCRGWQIKHWLEGNKYKNCNYCIVDDYDDILLEQKDNFVQINYETGFTENDIRRVLECLNK